MPRMNEYGRCPVCKNQLYLGDYDYMAGAGACAACVESTPNLKKAYTKYMKHKKDNEHRDKHV